MTDALHQDPAGFSADWLRQREPFDLAARHSALAAGFRAALTQPQGDAALRIIDLAAGSGANFRALAPLLQADQAWVLVDHDPRLLAAQRTEIARWATHQGWRCEDEGDGLRIDTGSARWQVRGCPLDLARQLEDIDLASCDGLVTTAFLDLVSAEWLDRLCAGLARARRPLLATLTVDGRRPWAPRRSADQLVTDAFWAHQGGDKGFGPSLGGEAVPYLAAQLTKQGYQVSSGLSDWHIGPEHPDMLMAMAREAAAVAEATNPGTAPTVAHWLDQRVDDIQRGVSSLTVGHLDLLAVPRS